MSEQSLKRPNPGQVTAPQQLTETRFGRFTAWAVLISLLFNLLVPLGAAAAPEPPSGSQTPAPVGASATPPPAGSAASPTAQSEPATPATSGSVPSVIPSPSAT